MCRFYRVVLGVLVSIGLILGLGVRVEAASLPKPKYPQTDPAKGTAPEYIEKAIAKAFEIVNQSPYTWGGGHGNEAQYNRVPPLLDCSSFVHWAYNRGAGLSLVSGVNSAGTNTKSLIANMDVRYGVEIKDLKRGDLIFFDPDGGKNNHVGLYLGEGMFINDENKYGVAVDSLTEGYWNKWYNKTAITVKEGGKGVKKGKAEPLKNGNVTGTTEDTTKSTTSSDKGSSKSYFNPFKSRTFAVNNVGVVGADEQMPADVSFSVSGWVKDFYKVMLWAATIISVAFFVYTTISVVWYFVMLSNSSVRGMDTFEKLTGLDSDKSIRTKLNVIGRWGASFLIITLFLTGLYVPIMGAMYRVVDGTGIFG